MKKKRENTALLVIALIPIVYLFSYNLLSNYTSGDQIAYHDFYNALNGAGIEKVMSVAVAVTSEEPLSAYILWTGSNLGIEKNVFISLLNVILIISLFLLARRYHLKKLMIVLLLTNFYVVVLMTSAERLKIAYIFLILAALFAGKVRLLLLTISPLAHFQNIILLSSLVLSYFEKSIKTLILLRSRIEKRAITQATFVLLAGVIFGYFIFVNSRADHGIWAKINIYLSQNNSLFDLWKLGILLMIALYVTRRRFRMFLIFLPTIVGAELFGGFRVNMIACTVVIYYLMEERRLHHPLIYILMVYFSIKTIPFIYKIFLYGDGFYSKM